ncbi:MAG: hypothetical protein ACXVEF_27895 [Polyangiales bacterium]
MKRFAVGLAIVSTSIMGARGARADVTGELGGALFDGDVVHHDRSEDSTGTHAITGFGPTLRLGAHARIDHDFSLGIAAGGYFFPGKETTVVRPLDLGTVYGAHVGPELDWHLSERRGVIARFGFGLSWAHLGIGSALGTRWSAAILRDLPVSDGLRLGFYARLDVDVLHHGDDASSSRLRTVIPSLGIAARML